MNKNQYRFVSETGLDVTMYRGDGAPYISDGIGGWQTVARQRRVGINQYVGVEPIHLVVPVLFDGWADQVSQEVAISTLERMARPAHDGAEPPAVKIYGGIPRPDIAKWLIEDLDYAGQTNVIWSTTSSGVTARMRQDLVVKFVQKVDEDRAAMSSLPGVGFGVGGAPGGRPTPKHPFHIVRQNEKLAHISAIEYGSAKYTDDIRNANGIRDGKAIKKGQKLRMP